MDTNKKMCNLHNNFGRIISQDGYDSPISFADSAHLPQSDTVGFPSYERLVSGALLFEGLEGHGGSAG